MIEPVQIIRLKRPNRRHLAQAQGSRQISTRIRGAHAVGAPRIIFGMTSEEKEVEEVDSDGDEYEVHFSVMGGVEKEVEEVVSDGDEYEEVLVYVKFPDFDHIELLTEESLADPLELTNINTTNPQCKFKDLAFTGKREINLGTQLFLAQDRESEHEPEQVQFHCSTLSCVKYQVSSLEEKPDEQKTDENRRD